MVLMIMIISINIMNLIIIIISMIMINEITSPSTNIPSFFFRFQQRNQKLVDADLKNITVSHANIKNARITALLEKMNEKRKTNVSKISTPF